MKLFKKLVLGQGDKKRMGKWIRQRFFLIAGKLVRSGRESAWGHGLGYIAERAN